MRSVPSSLSRTPLLALAALSLMAIAVGDCSGGGSWQFYGHDRGNTHYAKGESAISPDTVDQLEVKWVYQTTPDVPVDPLFPLAGLHSNVLHTILTGNFLRELSTTRMLLLVELPLLGLLSLRSLWRQKC